MSKYDLKELLKEMFQDGDIKIEVQGNTTYAIIDGEWIDVSHYY